MPKISELTNLTTLADEDIMAILDDTDNATKRISALTLAQYVTSSSSALSSFIVNNAFQETATNLGATVGTVTLANSLDKWITVYTCTNPDTGGGTDVALPAFSSGVSSFSGFVVIVNNDATYNIDFVNGSGTIVYNGTFGVTSITLAPYELVFMTANVNSYNVLYKG